MTTDSRGLVRGRLFTFSLSMLVSVFCLLVVLPSGAKAAPGPEDGPATGMISNWHLDETLSGDYWDTYNINYYIITFFIVINFISKISHTPFINFRIFRFKSF